MIKTQWMIVVLAVSLCTTTAEARGRRYVQQQGYTQQYYSAPAATQPAAPMQTVVTPSNGVIQTNAVEMSNGAIVQANSTIQASNGVVSTSAPAAGTAAQGSAQWKAEQSARLGSVQHLGGGFGGGSFEGNGFGATADQAIRNSCYWGQRTPIQIGVARGANGYYATIFYR